MNGSVPMLIHLGKQMLNQTDRTDVTSTGTGILKIEVVYPGDADGADEQPTETP